MGRGDGKEMNGEKGFEKDQEYRVSKDTINTGNMEKGEGLKREAYEEMRRRIVYRRRGRSMRGPK